MKYKTRCKNAGKSYCDQYFFKIGKTWYCPSCHKRYDKILKRERFHKNIRKIWQKLSSKMKEMQSFIKFK